MKKPIFSIIAPAIRRNLYEKVYRSLNKNNHISFEIVFVGFSLPKEEMPINFRYIYTKVNPNQCMEIAARESIGEYLIPITDDYLFSPNFLDKMYFYISKLYMDKVLVGNRYQMNGIFYDNLRASYERKIKNSPILLGDGAAFKRDVWMELGGLDRRFEGAFRIPDMNLRFYEYGYAPFIAPDIWINEIRDKNIKSDLWKRSGPKCKQLCNKFWIKDSIFSEKRLTFVKPFDDKDILIKDQYIPF